MVFLATLAVTAVLACLLRNPIKNHPSGLYAVAFALDVLLLASSLSMTPAWLTGLAVLLVRRGAIAVALFVVVMYVGVFPRSSRPALWLRPIRGELSIAACILIAGHMCSYLVFYGMNLMRGVMPALPMAIGLIVGIALLVLLAVLGATSLRAVKRRMTPSRWKRVQLLAYPFYAFIYVHAALMLGPSAFSGSAPAIQGLAAYTAVFLLYLVLRLCRARLDRQPLGDVADGGDGSASAEAGTANE